MPFAVLYTNATNTRISGGFRVFDARNNTPRVAPFPFKQRARHARVLSIAAVVKYNGNSYRFARG